jgi:hypothetical protein
MDTFLIGLVIGFLIALLGPVRWSEAYSDELEKEAIKRGYADYRVEDRKSPVRKEKRIVFYWKD